MIPILFEASEKEFRTNGIGRLSDATECYVEEERNGMYELTMKYPLTGNRFSDLEIGKIILATHDDTGNLQPFDIYKISKPIDGIVTVNARHISYRLSKHVLMPMRAHTAVEAFAVLPNYIIPETEFEFWTDSESVAEDDFVVTVPSSVRAMLGGAEGSILDTFRNCVYEWDRFSVKFHTRRGRDTDVTIRYGKNLADITYTESDSETFTAIAPYWQGTSEDGLTDEVVVLPEKIIVADYQDVTIEEARVKATPLDLSYAFQEKPTVAQLRTEARRHLRSHKWWEHQKTIKVDFVQLWQTTEYANFAPLQRLSLCDTVNVYHEGLGVISESIEIIRVEYNVLLDRYNKMELGSVRTHMGDTIQDQVKTEILKTVPTKSTLTRAVDLATQLITGGLGGHVVISRNADGQPNEILIMDTEDISTAVNVLRINMNGIGFSTTGYEGPFRNAWTIDGHFVADFIDTGTLNANLMRAGVIASRDGKSYWNLDTGEWNLRAESVMVVREGDVTSLAETIDTMQTLTVALSKDIILLEAGADNEFADAYSFITVSYGKNDVTYGADITVKRTVGVTGTWDVTLSKYTVSAISAKNGSVTFEIEYNGITVEKTLAVAEITQGQSSILVLIESSAGNIFKNRGVNTLLTAHVYYGTEEVTDEIPVYHWYKNDASGILDPTWSRDTGNIIQISPSDVSSRAVFYCEVEYDPD